MIEYRGESTTRHHHSKIIQLKKFDHLFSQTSRLFDMKHLLQRLKVYIQSPIGCIISVVVQRVVLMSSTSKK
jgi:hypothetical protein